MGKGKAGDRETSQEAVEIGDASSEGSSGGDGDRYLGGIIHMARMADLGEKERV